MNDVISMRDFSKEEIIAILDIADDVKKAIHDDNFNQTIFKEKYGRAVNNLLQGVSVATLFLENSTRTNYSFRAAVMKAGGKFDGFPSQTYTSLQKGETWADTAAMFAGYGYDAIIMRSTTEGLPRWTKEFLIRNQQLLLEQHHQLKLPFNYKIPLIVNGGDGKNQHPTQCFLDLFTMREIARAHGQELDGLKLALLNDLAHGRTNASLMSIAHLFNFELHFAYPPRFGPQKHRLEDLRRKGVRFYDHQSNFKEAMEASFIAYHSRPQKERVGAGEDLITIKTIGQINKQLYDSLGEKAPYLMHPLPVDAETFEEIAADMCDHPKNITKLQSSNGLYVRIALLAAGLRRIQLIPFNSFMDGTKMHLHELPLSQIPKEQKNPRSGYIEDCGVVLDHIPAGLGRRLAGVLGFEKWRLPKVISDFMPVKGGRWLKDMIKLHAHYQFSSEQYEACALLAPNITISFVQGGKVICKVRPILGNIIVDRITCGNAACVTNVKKEQVVPKHYLESVEEEKVLRCCYCEQGDTISQVYESNRFKYIGEKKN